MRIVQTTDVDGSVLLKLEGKMRDQWVDELRQLTLEILQKPDNRVVLDLAEVTFIDTRGFALLLELLSRHVRLKNCSLFVTHQLKAIEQKR